ncbi:hypothetical protein [Salinarimonas rosea]|uniref:hypothetical protein n=1 Tax=Salinarimonas rosea TaxID=552063 RepID=UPI000413320F|nr:hypothetical protein [Salinarimonas rosea]
MAVWIRIGLRYLAGMLVMKGLLTESESHVLAGDPELVAALEVAVGTAIAAGTEAAYALAKRLGWRT